MYLLISNTPDHSNSSQEVGWTQLTTVPRPKTCRSIKLEEAGVCGTTVRGCQDVHSH